MARYTYSNDAKEIIRNVHEFCKSEKNEGLKMSLNKAIQRTAVSTGISAATVKRVVSCAPPEKLSFQKPVSGKAKLEFDNFDLGVVRRTINNMYVQQKVLPTLSNLKASLRESIGYTGSKSHLRKQLKLLGFSYHRCKVNRKILMERKDVILYRITYLRKIKQLREAGHPTVYTDETFVHSSHSVMKCWQNGEIGLKVPFSKGERMIVLHAGSKDQFIPSAELVFKAKSSSGDYHSEMNSQNFQKWLTEKLIPDLPPNSVVVMDNATYHNVQIDRCPTSATRKAEIRDWLRWHHVQFDDSLLKIELLELCKQHRHTVFVVDEMLARHGHQAIQLPPYHADLNPIELIWGNLKGQIARKNISFSLAKVKELIQNGLQSITRQV